MLKKLGIDKTELCIILLTLTLITFPFIGAPKSVLLYLFLFFVYMTLSMAWNLVAGYAGLVSLCPPAFFGLAGYSLAIFTLLKFSVCVAIGVGILVAILFALIISIPIFRLMGIYFSISTLVIPEALRIAFFLWRPIKGTFHGGGAGYMIPVTEKLKMETIYLFSLFVAAFSIYILKKIKNSKFGFGLAAIRDNQRAATSCGINVYKLKLQSFIISAILIALAGSVFYIYQGFIEPSSAFNIKWTMIAMLSTVIGGMGTLFGPVMGSAFVTFLHFLLARYGNLSLLIQGVILVAIMLLLPRGIMGFLLGKSNKVY